MKKPSVNKVLLDHTLSSRWAVFWGRQRFPFLNGNILGLKAEAGTILELSAESSRASALQYSSLEPHVTTKHLKCGEGD